MRVSLMITCVVDVVAPEVGEASVRVLRAAGCEVAFRDVAAGVADYVKERLGA